MGRFCTMSEQRLILLLLICCTFLLFALFKVPDMANSKASITSDEERLKNAISKFVKSIGDIQARVQVIEEKLEGIGKQEGRNEPVGEKVAPNKEGIAGEIKQDTYCLDSAHRKGGKIALLECHGQKGNQFYELKDGKIHHNGFCLSVKKVKPKANIIMKKCGDSSVTQEWTYHDEYFQLGESGFCMTRSGESVILEQCREDEQSQIWAYRNE